MSLDRFSRRSLRLTLLAALVLIALASLSFLAACGGPEPTAQVVVITATYTQEPAVLVVTATFTPPPEDAATESSGSGVGTGSEAATAAASATPPPPASATPAPPTATSPPPTWTPLPDTPTEAPAVATKEQTTTKAKASLADYGVVYTSHAGGAAQNYTLWAMRGDGADATQFLENSSEPVFSPSGNQFVFYHWTDGLHIWDFVKETATHFIHNSEAAWATWSPNGKRIAYGTLLNPPTIHLVNPDGSGDVKLTPGLRPNWALKGGFIAYDSCENNKCGIFRINPDGGGKQQLTDDSGGGAAVSPNGAKIAYWSQADGDFEVYVINADGSGKKQLTSNRGNDALPTWSPDGSKIYYLSDQNGTGWAVMVMNAGGANPRKIVDVQTHPDPGRGWQYQRIAVTWWD